jgi:hypothetical protein
MAPAASNAILEPTPLELALLTAWRRLPATASAALLTFNLAFLGDYGLDVRASIPEAPSAEPSDPLGEAPETS